MSSMTPVVLVSLPNLPYLLGTFDTTSFKQWWRSAPFPDELQNIKKGFHIYGRTHLAIAQRTDGLWAVYRSKNYGIDWERAWLAAAGEKIYDIVLITFGWAILNTSLGFYETVNAGKTWTLVLALPSAPNAPAFYNIGGGDILMCTDGRYIWRSTDIARHWTLVCDMHAVVHFYGGYYQGPSNPCIVGANGRVWAANGPFLIRSDDGGLTFGRISYWDVYGTDHPPSTTILGHRLYDSLDHPLQSPPLLITELNISSIDGIAGDDVVILIKLDDLIPVPGQTQLFTYLFKSYTSGVYKNNYYKPIFQQFLSSDVSGQHLSSYNVAVLGADYNDRLVFSAQTKVVNGVSVPSLKYSTDGGVTWIDIDVTNIKIGDQDEGGNYGGSMLDDNFAKLTWIAPPCNNQGSYDVVELSRRQCQSYEVEGDIEATKTPSYQADALVEKDKAVTESVDSLAEADIPKSYDVDAFAEGRNTKSYRIDRTCEGTSTKDEEIDAIVEKDQDVLESVDAHVWGRPKRYYLVGVFLRPKRSASYLCDTILVKDGSTESVQKMIAKLPQFMDLVDPGLPYEVYNSRKVSR